MLPRLCALTTLLMACGLVGSAAAQDGVSDTLEVTLPEITVDAVRSTESSASAPYAVSVQIRGSEELAFEPTTSLETVLRSLPGVWVNDRGHFALGERISIRGMGARAAFGVRGVQVLLDGVPLTMPDGQSTLDIVEPSILRQVELLRSPASLFWGNGSGGVLFLSSAAAPDAPTLRLKGLGGSYGQRKMLAEGALPLGRHHVRGYASHQAQDGYRDYSTGSLTRFGATGRFLVGANTLVRAVGAAAVQDTDHPGSLTRAQVEENPQMARPGFAETNSGKESTQVQGGLTVEHQLASLFVSATGYGLTRSLENPLPFGFIDLDRTAMGMRATMQDRRGRVQWGMGVDAGLQHDIRKNWDNDNGEPGDELDLDQIEDVSSAGAFGYARYAVLQDLLVTAGLRRSTVRFELDDQLLENGDDSGHRRFAAWSPSVGVGYRTGAVLFFANYGTAFETPTTTELVNRPEMTGGFNEALDPQISKGIEGGVRGVLPMHGLEFDVAAFFSQIEGRLVSFTNDLGREFFRNAGENTHRGVEIALAWTPISAASLRLTYTGSRFVFEDDELEGNMLPGVPEHRVFLSAEGQRTGLWLRVAGEVVSEYFVDDRNTVSNEGYAVADLHVGHRGLTAGTARVEPFVTVRNVFDTRYNASVVVNAAGDRFFEPAPGRAVLAGLQVTL